jgi:hypothetical protein
LVKPNLGPLPRAWENNDMHKTILEYSVHTTLARGLITSCRQM